MIRLFRVFVPVGALTLLVSEVILLAASFVLATYIVLTVDPRIYLLYDGGWLRITVVLVSILIGLHFHDLYSQIHVTSRVLLLQQLCLVVGVAFLLQGLISYLDPYLRVPIRVMVLGSAISVLVVFGWRIFFSRYAMLVMGRDRLLMVGDSPLLADIGVYIDEHPATGLVVAGYLGDAYETGTPLPGGKVLGGMNALRAVVTATHPNRIIVGMTDRRSRVPVADLLELRFAGHIIEEAASAYERICGRVCVKELRPSQLIYSGELGPRRQNVIYQTIANLLSASLGIVLSFPLMLLTAVAVRLSSPGPILYRQQRVGLDGVPFTVYKFRSMRADAEAATGAVWAARHDPRVTAVGRVIRKIRFDELPQLFNVLKGDMSIVGPRPERPEFVKTFVESIPYYSQRHSVRPGITGWAQINYKYGDTLQDTIYKLEYDLYYIKNMSLSLDSYIIFHTVKAMLLSRGAQ